MLDADDLAELALGFEHPGSQHFLRMGRGIGITDAFTIFAQDGEGRGVNVSAPIDGLVETAPRVRALLPACVKWRPTKIVSPSTATA